VSEAIDFHPLLPAIARRGRRRSHELPDGRARRGRGGPPWNFPLSIPASGVLAALTARQQCAPQARSEAVLVGWHLARRSGKAASARGASVRAVPRRRRGARAHHRPRVDAVILTGSAETARRFSPGALTSRSSPRRAARTRWSSRRWPTATGFATWFARPWPPGAEVFGGEPRHLRGRGVRRRRVPTSAPRCRGQPRCGQRVGHVEPDHAADPAPAKRSGAPSPRWTKARSGSSSRAW
jgi:hypothetical protein